MPRQAKQLQLHYRLPVLPTVQHRAGLAGLLFALRSMRVGANKGAPEFSRDSDSLEVCLDKEGLSALLDFLYADVEVTRTTSSKPKGEYEEIEVEQRDGKVVKRYQYRDRRPAGTWLTRCGYGPEWLALWQDSIWSTLRDKPASRKIYTGPTEKLADAFWKALTKAEKDPEATLALASALYIGARARSNEDVAFDGTPQDVFLLHFAHAIAQPFRVVGLDSLGKRTYPGLVWVYPEPGDLRWFVDDFRSYLGTRRQSSEEDVEKVDFYWSTRVTMPAEAGLKVLDIALAKIKRDVVTSAFCAQLDKQGNNVNLLGVAHIRADPRLLGPYRKIVAPVGNYALRRLLLSNLLSGAPLYRGAAALISSLPSEATLPKSEPGRGFSSNAKHVLKHVNH